MWGARRRRNFWVGVVVTDEEIGQLVARFPLPDGGADCEMNLTQLARALGTNTNTLGRWIIAGMPVIEAGTNGSEYRLSLAACYAWRQHQLEAERQAKAAAEARANEMARRLTGMETLPVQMTPKEQRTVLENQRIWLEIAKAQRQLVPIEEVVQVLERVLSEARAACDAGPDKLERELGLKGRQVELAIEVFDGVLVSIKNALDAYVEEAGDPPPPVGADGQVELVL